MKEGTPDNNIQLRVHTLLLQLYYSTLASSLYMHNYMYGGDISELRTLLLRTLLYVEGSSDTPPPMV